LVSHNSAGASSAEASATRIPVDVRRVPWARRLAVDYAYQFPSVAPFFNGNPAQHDDWAAAIARTTAQPRRHAEIAAVIAAQQQRRQAPAPAVEAAARLSDARTVAIVTGQQAGLFGGPLFTLFKAMTAIRLAEEVSSQHHVPAVAVFWVEGEDHDWDEVRSCTVFDDQFDRHTVGLPPRPSGDPSPVAQVILDASIQSTLDELRTLLPPTEFTPALLEALARAYAPGIGMADAFARWLEHLLGPRGLVVYDSSDRAAKVLASPVFVRELSTVGETGRLAGASGADMVKRGYHAQVHAQDDSLAIFRLDEARRVIRRQENGLAAGDRQYTVDSMLADARERPAAFSPGVLLRPIVQDTLFPTACYVAGPSELAYLGQLKAVYEHFGVPMPLMYPRASASILDSASIRFLTKYQLPFESLQARDESALNALLETQIPPSVEASFAGARATIEQHMSQVAQSVGVVDPTLEGAAKSTIGRMQHDLDTLHGKMIQAAKRRHDTLRRQFVRTRGLAFPGGEPQERAIGFISMLNQYGPALIDRLHEELPLDLGHHWLVTI
jgi:bacillithiol biosynthesis cysteine-adding enzyme BshC